MWFKRKQKNLHPLDQELFRWNERDAYRVRDLLNGGCLIVGRAGSGKTSSSGRLLMQSIVDKPKSALLILAAKPEDADDVQAIFKEGQPNKRPDCVWRRGRLREQFFRLPQAAS